MNVYVIVAPSEKVAENIEREYPDRFPIVPESVWAVADSRGTSFEVCERVGIGTSRWPDDGVGVVLKLDQFYGTFDNALWQKIDVWQKEPA